LTVRRQCGAAWEQGTHSMPHMPSHSITSQGCECDGPCAA
jgi:hypothetical protein